MLDRARAAGFGALFLTVVFPLPGTAVRRKFYDIQLANDSPLAIAAIKRSKAFIRKKSRVVRRSPRDTPFQIAYLAGVLQTSSNVVVRDTGVVPCPLQSSPDPAMESHNEEIPPQSFCGI
jgi:hypothetical protein